MEVLPSYLPIGIDLGSQNVRSCIFDGYSKEITNNPSMQNQVSFGKQILIGDRAATVARKNRIVGYRTILGHNWDEIVEENLLDANTKNLTNVENYPEYSVSYRDENLSVKPEVVASLVLDEIIRQSGKAVENAVVAVPQNFNQNQRKAVLNSAKLSNLNVLCLVNKTTAAAVGYYHLTRRREMNNVLIYHLGSECFDFAVCDFGANEVRMVNSSGGFKLGGSFINDLIYDKVCSETNLRNLSEKTEDSLLKSIELAKMELLSSESASISDFDYDYVLKRSDFNKMVYKNVVLKTIEIIDKHLNEWELNINGAILIGSCCKIPILVDRLDTEYGLLSREFKDENLVAKGASIVGALFTKQIDAFEVKDAYKTRILLNKDLALYNKLVEIDLFGAKTINLDVCTNGLPSLNFDFSIDFSGILNPSNNASYTQQVEYNDRKRISQNVEKNYTYYNLRKICNGLNEYDTLFEKMAGDKEYLTSQNMKLQILKESMNSLKDLLDYGEEEIENMLVPDKYKRIFYNLKERIYSLKIRDDLTVECIKRKEECVRNYLNYLKVL